MFRALFFWAALIAPAAASSPPNDIPQAVDISVAGVVLTDPASTVAVLGDKVVWKDEVLPRATFLNASKTEELTVTVHNGDYNNSISEVLVQVPQFGTAAVVLSGINQFTTGKGIQLGITEIELTTLLGKPTSAKRIKTNATLRYDIADIKTSSFLQYYNRPIYYGVYTFKHGKLIAYGFGFEYP